VACTICAASSSHGDAIDGIRFAFFFTVLAGTTCTVDWPAAFASTSAACSASTDNEKEAGFIAKPKPFVSVLVLLAVPWPSSSALGHDKLEAFPAPANSTGKNACIYSADYRRQRLLQAAGAHKVPPQKDGL
jgi:hypothetical protein